MAGVNNDEDSAVVFVEGRPNSRPYDKRVQFLIGVLVVTSLSTAVICIGMCMVTLQALRDFEGRMIETNSILTQEKETRASQAAQKLTTTRWQYPRTAIFDGLRRSKRRAGDRRHRRDRRRRRNSSHRRHEQHTPSFLHLPGTTSPNDDAFFYNGNFVWGTFNSSDDPGLGLSVINNTHPHLIRINEAGIYEVYSQIGIEGRGNRNSNNHHVACGHKTVLSRNNRDKDLMESRVTQHNLGNAYSTSGFVQRFAFDTILHRGTFKLFQNDTLRVRRVANCNHFRFRSNPTFAYFSVVQIHKFHRHD